MYNKINRLYVVIAGLAVIILCSYIKTAKPVEKEEFANPFDETACTYVSSRGILKSCDIYDPYPKSSTQDINIDYSKILEGSTVYVATSAIPNFIKNMDKIQNRFILVSGDSDDSIYGDLFSSHEEFLNFIQQGKIIHWFAQNCLVSHPKISQMPIGLDYHTLAHKSHKWGNKINPVKQERILKGIQTRMIPFYKRKIHCYSNFHFSILEHDKFSYERTLAIKEIPKDLIYYESAPRARKDTWIAQSEYAFVISPPGNGLDCHRTWEALCLGCIPIVKTSDLNSLYEDLPVFVVSSWSDITGQALENIIETFRNRQFKYEKLNLSYWMGKINSFKDAL